MELSELQQRVDAWIRQYGVRYFSELTNMAVLTEEVGELARIMARKYGDQSFKEGEKCNLADEMADVLWVLVCLANQTGVDLTAAVEANFAKKTSRDKERHLHNPKLLIPKSRLPPQTAEGVAPKCQPQKIGRSDPGEQHPESSTRRAAPNPSRETAATGRPEMSATKNRTIRPRRAAPGEQHRTLRGKQPQRVAPKCQPQKIGRSDSGE